MQSGDVGPIAGVHMAQIHIDRPASLDDFLGEGRHHIGELAPFQPLGIMALHETLAQSVDEPRPVGDRHIVAGEIEFLHQHIEGAAEGEFHVDEARARAKGHGHPIARVIVDAMGSLHGDHAGGDYGAPGVDEGELARIDVEAHRPDDARLAWPLAVGSHEFGDMHPVQYAHAARRDAPAQFAHRRLGLILHAPHIDHAATGEAADGAILRAGNGNAPAFVILHPLLLSLQKLIGPALVAHEVAALDEFARPQVEIITVEGTCGDAPRHGGGTAFAHIGLVHQSDAGPQISGAQRGPGSGETTADDQHIRLQHLDASRHVHMMDLMGKTSSSGHRDA